MEARCLLTFLSPVDYPAGPAPQAVAVADFDNDGATDAAVVNFDVGINILLGDAHGGFAPPYSATRGEWPHSYPLAAGDIDGDGNADLIYGDQALLGNGDGTFGDPQYLGLPAEAQIYPLWIDSIAPGDFNMDGVLDLAYSLTGSWSWCDPYDPYWCGTYPYSYVAVVLGQGDGTFSIGSYPSLSGPSSVNAGDVDHDGALDLVTVDGVYYGDGAGSFQLRGSAIPELASASQWYSSVESSLADFDADGQLDLLAVNSAEPVVLLGDASGGFHLTAFLPAASGSDFVVASDLNLDGFPDAIVTGMDSTNNPGVLLNDGEWSKPLPSLQVSDASVVEGHNGTTSAVFTVTLSAPVSQLVTVSYFTEDGTAAGGSDYTSANGTLAIPAGQTTGVIKVSVNGDRLGEEDETFFVNLSNPAGATIADGQARGTITDDEPRVSITDVTKYEGRKGRITPFTFVITLSAAYDQPVTMSYQTVNGTATTSNNDYVAVSGTITFAPGETRKEITISVKGDNRREVNETFYLDLFGLSSNALFTKKRGIGTILNDD